MKDTEAIDDVRSSARCVVLSVLGRLPPHERGKLASAIIDGLVTARLLRLGIEQHYNATDLAALLGRCDEYVVKLIKSGQLQPVSRDGAGWLIPASTVRTWLEAHQFGKSTTSGVKETGVSPEKF